MLLYRLVLSRSCNSVLVLIFAEMTLCPCKFLDNGLQATSDLAETYPPATIEPSLQQKTEVRSEAEYRKAGFYAVFSGFFWGSKEASLAWKIETVGCRTPLICPVVTPPVSDLREARPSSPI